MKNYLLRIKYYEASRKALPFRLCNRSLCIEVMLIFENGDSKLHSCDLYFHGFFNRLCSWPLAFRRAKRLCNNFYELPGLYRGRCFINSYCYSRYDHDYDEGGNELFDLLKK